MVNLLLHWFISTASLLIVAYIFPGIEVRGFGTALLAPIVIGLVISIPIIVFGATLISKLLDRFHWLGMVGAALIGWIAGEVMAGDGRRDVAGADGKLVETIEPGTLAAWLDAHLPHAELVAAIVGALFVVGLGLLLARRKARPHRQG